MQEIKKIFADTGLEVKEFSNIETFYNSVTKIHTDKGNFFVKKYNDRTGYKLSNLYPMLEKQGLPVPRVLKYDDSCQIINQPYLIISQVNGKMLCATELNDEKQFYYDLGQILARIHSITFGSFGETFDGKTIENYQGIRPSKTWKGMYEEIIKKRLQNLEKSDFEDLIKPINEWFQKNFHLLDYKITPRLLHEDLNQKNIFVKDNRISGIIDFDGSFVGHNEEELMRTEGANFSGNDFRQVFLEGYTRFIPLDQGYAKRRRFYYLSRLLVHIHCVIQNGEDYVGNLKKEENILREEIDKIINHKEINFDKNRVNT